MTLREQSTIAATATPYGKAGVSILRLSGPDAYSIASSITKKKHFSVNRATRVTFFTKKNEAFDDGIVLFFEAPYSFTGEDVVELHTHGNPIIQQILLETCLFYGAILAQPGEFSKRAFCNEKIALSEAESISDIIAAHSVEMQRAAYNLKNGSFSKIINELIADLSESRVLLETMIDFSDEPDTFLLEKRSISTLLSRVNEKINYLASQYTTSEYMRKGVRCCLIGPPNVGKSSLLNWIAGEEVAIVTDIPGTTRDLIKHAAIFKGVPYLFIDSAGIRPTLDKVESLGIERTKAAIRESDIILHIQDSFELGKADVESMLSNIEIPILYVRNKMDLIDTSFDPKYDDSKKEVTISAKDKKGKDVLFESIEHALSLQRIPPQFLLRERHYTILIKVREHIESVLQKSETLAIELLAEEIRETQGLLEEISGKTVIENVLDQIFSSFCIGK